MIGRLRALTLGLAVALAIGLGAAPGMAAKTPAKPRRPATTPAPNTKLFGATVLAAASLTEAFQAMAPKESYSFAGSDQLAFQIQQGIGADVFASANVRYPDQLYARGLVRKPILFTYNNLVVIVPRKNPARITQVRDLARPGVKLVIGDPSVPVGSYTRTVFKSLGLNAALGNVVSNENDVKAVAGKVALGEADAGIVYQTDITPVKKLVRAIQIPAEAQPVAAYEIAVVSDAPHPAQAQAFVKYVTSRAGRAWLKTFGFILPSS
jgi:molybdate transport system substrate-binding protein